MFQASGFSLTGWRRSFIDTDWYADNHVSFSTTISVVIAYYNIFYISVCYTIQCISCISRSGERPFIGSPRAFLFSFFWDVFVFTIVFSHNSFHAFYIVFRHTFFCQFFDVFLSSSCCGPYFLYTGIVLCSLCILVSSYIASAGTYFFIFAIISF